MKRGPKGPRIDDGLALEQMAALVAKGGFTENAAADKIAKSISEQHSVEASAHRLRRKYRSKREQEFKRRTAGIPGLAPSSRPEPPLRGIRRLLALLATLKM